MAVDYVDLGRRIRDIRKKNGLTQEQLAELMGISAAFLGHIERGTRVASLETLVAVCNALQVSPAFLLCRSLETYETYMPSTLSSTERERLGQFLRLAQDTVSGWNDE